MLNTAAIVDLLREKTETRTDYAVAKLIGCRPQAVCNWKSSRHIMGDDIGLKAAQLLDLPPDYVIASLHAERTKGTDLFAVWSSMAEQLTPKKRRKAA